MWAKYRNFDEFEREQIRPGLRVGWSLDNINDPSSIELDFDEDPFERALLESEQDDEEEELDDGEYADGFDADGEHGGYRASRDSEAPFAGDAALDAGLDSLER
jgi:hypothetical protein